MRVSRFVQRERIKVISATEMAEPAEAGNNSAIPASNAGIAIEESWPLDGPSVKIERSTGLSRCTIVEIRSLSRLGSGFPRLREPLWVLAE